ncbi:MAG: radical SAM protein [Caulobacteraceae bacterium]
MSCLCNLKCIYCPHPKSWREKGLMSIETFIRCMELIKKLNQKWVCLHNFGEPLLHPQIEDIIKIARKYVDYVYFSTNGTLLSREKAIRLKECGLSKIILANHDSISTEKAISSCRGLDIVAGILNDFYLDWAGTSGRHPLHYRPTGYMGRPNGCKAFIEEEVVVVLWDGRINSCCVDMEGLGIVGNVYDENAIAVKPKKFTLCEHCNIDWVDSSGIKQIENYIESNMLARQNS